MSIVVSGRHDTVRAVQRDGGKAMDRILITGAAGEIGTTLREGLRGAYALLRLTDRQPLGTAARGEEIVTADLTNSDAVRTAMRDIECVVHLGGVPREAPWDA